MTVLHIVTMHNIYAVKTNDRNMKNTDMRNMNMNINMKNMKESKGERKSMIQNKKGKSIQKTKTQQIKSKLVLPFKLC